MTANVTKEEIIIRDKLSELDRPTGVAGQAMLRAETPQEQFNLISAGRRRLNINGCMSVWQRGTTLNVPDGTGYLLADRWLFRDSVDATCVMSQSNDTPSGQGFKHSLKITTSSTDDAIGSSQYSRIQYNMEGQDALQFGYGTPEAKPVTISFWVKSKVAGKYSLSIEVAPGTQDYRTCIKSYVISHADEWEHKVVTFPPLTTHALAVTDHELGWKVTMPLVVGQQWWDDANEGRWRTDGTYVMGLSGCTNPFRLTGDIFFMTGMQIEVGSVATPFEHRSYGEELDLCQRYFQSHSSGDLYTGFGNAHANNGSYVEIYGYEYIKEMRAVPDLSVSAAGDFSIRTSSNAVHGSATSIFLNRPGTQRANISFGSSGLTTGASYHIVANGTATATLNFDAEF